MAHTFNYTSKTIKSGRRTYQFTLSVAGVKFIFAYTDGEANAIANKVAADLLETVSVAPALVAGYVIETQYSDRA